MKKIKEYLLGLTYCMALVTHAEAGTIRVPLESGSSTVALLQTSVTPVNLGDRPIGVLAYKTISYKNNSGSKATVTNIETNEQISLIEGTCASLTPEESCNLTFAYLVDKEGEQSSNINLYVTSNQNSYINKFNFTANGITPISVLTVAPVGANFSYAGEVKSFIVKNNQTFPLPAGVVTISDKNWMIFENNCTSKSLNPGEECEVKVKYIATRAGSSKGDLTVLVNSIPYGSAQLNGSLILGYPSFDVSQLDFGGIPAGKNVSKSFGLSNNSKGKLVLSKISYTGDPYFKLGASTCPLVLESGQSCTIEVVANILANKVGQGSIIFNFLNAGQSIATVGIYGDSNVPNRLLEATPVPLNFEAKLPGESSSTNILLKSTGNGSVTIKNILSTDTKIRLNNLQQCEGVVLAQGEICNFSAEFLSNQEGTYTGTITVSSDGPPLTIPYTANMGVITLVANPTSVELKGMDDGRIAQNITITNNSVFSTTVSKVKLDTALNMDLDTCTGVVLKGGQACSIKISPSSAFSGKKAAPVVVEYSSGAVLKYLSIPLSLDIVGQGLEFSAFVCPSNATTGVQGECVATLKNKGTSNITVTSLSGSSAAFSVPVLDGVNLPYSLAGGKSIGVKLKYTMAKVGSYFTTITAKSLSASYAADAALNVGQNIKVELTDFSCPIEQIVGDTPICTATLANKGSVAYSITAITSRNPVFSIAHTCGTSLAINKSCVISAKVGLTQFIEYSTVIDVKGVPIVSKPIALMPNAVAMEPSAVEAVSTPVSVPVTGVVKFKNNSGFNVKLGAATKTVSGTGFSLLSSTCTGVILKNATCDISFKFVSPYEITNSKGIASLQVGGQTFVAPLIGSAKVERLTVTRNPGQTTIVGYKSYSGNVYTVQNNSLKPQTITSILAPASVVIDQDAYSCKKGAVLGVQQKCEFLEYVSGAVSPSANANLFAVSAAGQVLTKEGLKGTWNSSYKMLNLSFGLKNSFIPLNINEDNKGTLVITNTALVPLTGAEVSVGAVAGVTVNVLSAECLKLISPGESCEVPVVVKAIKKGAANVTATLKGAYIRQINAVNTGLGESVAQAKTVFSVSFVDPAGSLVMSAYPETKVDDTQYAVHTFKNSGKSAISIKESSIESAKKVQEIVEDKCKGVVINPGQSCTIKTSLFAKPGIYQYDIDLLTLTDISGVVWKGNLIPNVVSSVVVDYSNSYCEGGISHPLDLSLKLNLNSNQGSAIVCKITLKNEGGQTASVLSYSSLKESTGVDGTTVSAPFVTPYAMFVQANKNLSVYDMDQADYMDSMSYNTTKSPIPFRALTRVPGTSLMYLRNINDKDNPTPYNGVRQKYIFTYIYPGRSTSFVFIEGNTPIGGGKKTTISFGVKNSSTLTPTDTFSTKDYKEALRFELVYNVKHPNMTVSANANFPITNLTKGQSVTSYITNNDIELLPISIYSGWDPDPWTTLPVNYKQVSVQYNWFTPINTLIESNSPLLEGRIVTNKRTGVREFVTNRPSTGFTEATNCFTTIDYYKGAAPNSVQQIRFDTASFIISQKSLAPGQSCYVRRSCLEDPDTGVALKASDIDKNLGFRYTYKNEKNELYTKAYLNDHIRYQYTVGMPMEVVSNFYSPIGARPFDYASSVSVRTLNGVYDPYTLEYFDRWSDTNYYRAKVSTVSAPVLYNSYSANPFTEVKITDASAVRKFSPYTTGYPSYPGYSIYENQVPPTLICKIPSNP